MKNEIKKYHIIGTVFIILLGTLLHFVYEWSDRNTIIGILGAINESTWEHLKLLFWPAFIFSILEYIIIGNDFKNYITAKAVSFFVGILLITSLFYTYTGIFGKHFLVVDISIFIISVIISQYIGYKIVSADSNVSKKTKVISLIGILLLVLLFILLTFVPPQIPLFKDPVTGEYGI